MNNYICVYCKKVFRGNKGKVPCPNCGYQRPCSGHRVMSNIEAGVLRKSHPKAFKKDKPGNRPSGKRFKQGSG